MYCKFYIEKIRHKIRECMAYYWKAKEAKDENDLEASRYLLKLASDEYEHAGLLFKLLEEHIKKKTVNEEYNGVYKQLYEMSIDVLKDEYKDAEDLIKKA